MKNKIYLLIGVVMILGIITGIAIAEIATSITFRNTDVNLGLSTADAKLLNPLTKYDLVIGDINCVNQACSIQIMRGPQIFAVAYMKYEGDISTMKEAEFISLRDTAIQNTLNSKLQTLKTSSSSTKISAGGKVVL